MLLDTSGVARRLNCTHTTVDELRYVKGKLIPVQYTSTGDPLFDTEDVERLRAERQQNAQQDTKVLEGHLKTSEVALRLKCGRKHVARLVQKGKLTAQKTATGLLRFTDQDVEAFINKKEERAQQRIQRAEKKPQQAQERAPYKKLEGVQTAYLRTPEVAQCLNCSRSYIDYLYKTGKLKPAIYTSRGFPLFASEDVEQFSKQLEQKAEEKMQKVNKRQQATQERAERRKIAQSDLLNASEVAQRLNCSPTNVYSLVFRGKLIPVATRGRRFKPEEVERLAKENEERSAAHQEPGVGLLNTSEVARRLICSRTYIYQLCRSGKLVPAAQQISTRAPLFRSEDVERLIQEKQESRHRVKLTDGQLTSSEVVLRLNCTRQYVSLLVKEGKLTAQKTLGRLTFKREDVELFIKENAQKAMAPRRRGGGRPKKEQGALDGNLSIRLSEEENLDFSVTAYLLGRKKSRLLRDLINEAIAQEKVKDPAKFKEVKKHFIAIWRKHGKLHNKEGENKNEKGSPVPVVAGSGLSERREQK